jgi:hypothetical protein
MWHIQRALIRALLAALAFAACLQIAILFLAPARGLRAEYFAGERAAGTPVISGIDRDASTGAIQSRWLGAAPLTFTARWFGFLNLERAARYTFSLSSDDGAVLTIDGQPAIDNSGRHGLQTQTVTLPLTRGSHSIVIDFTQQGGEYALSWSMAQEGRPLQSPAEWMLTPAKVAVGFATAARIASQAAGVLLLLAALLGVALGTHRRDVVCAHPRIASLALFVLLAVVHTWPLASDVAHLTRHDNRDSILNEWIVAWVAHQLPRSPLHLFDGNIFHPERYTLAYSEPMIVQGLLAMPLLWSGASIVLTCNLLLIAGMAFSGWTMALVVRRWTGDWTAALVAGAIFAFNAHSLSRIPHLQAQHLEFLPLTLFAFDRIAAVPTRRNAVKLASWFILQSLTSVYLLVITTFALMAAGVARAADLHRHGYAAARTVAVAGGISLMVLLPFLLPYWFVSRDLGLVRSLSDAGNYAATWSAYLTTPARLHAWWSARLGGANVLFPGMLGLVLTGVAVLKGGALRDGRARMCLAIGVAGIALSFGAQMPGYSLLYDAMPLLRGIRATARFGILATLAVSVLAGFGVVTLRRMIPVRAWTSVSLLLIACASLESLAAPLGLIRFDGIPPIYAQVPRTSGTVVLEVPFFGSRGAQFHAHYMLDSTVNWQPIVNGYSGFQPPSFYENAQALQDFPHGAAVARMRALRVTHVFVHADQMPDGVLAAMDARSDVERAGSFGGIVLYRLKPQR